MKIHRIYIKDYLESKSYSITNKEELNHLVKVLRLRVGENIIIFNGKGDNDYLYEIKKIDKSEIYLTLNKIIVKSKVEAPDLYLAIPKSGIEDIIRSCVEIGVNNIYPIITERTEKKDVNIERLDKIIIESSEQCDRNSIPKLSNPVKLTDATLSFENSVVYHTDVPQNDNVTQEYKNIRKIFVGPEGGFSESEIEYMTSRGALVRKLTTYTLRTVTAAPICLFDSMQAN